MARVRIMDMLVDKTVQYLPPDLIITMGREEVTR